jgi:hypothetical protein
MRDFWIYDLEMAESYFEIDLINVMTSERKECFILYEKHTNMDTLVPLLSRDLMIGVGNHNHADIFLNYIWYNKANVTNKELFGLKKAIDDKAISVYDYYRNLGVDTIDLSKLTDYLYEVDSWRYNLPFKMKGVELTYYFFDQMCERISRNYKKEFQIRRDLCKASLTSKGMSEVLDYIFYKNVKDRTKSEV